MPRDERELEALADRLEKRLDERDPDTIEWDDLSDLREIAEAADAVEAAEQRVLEAVARARANGRSWGRIGLSLDVTRQAARQRFADKVDA